MSNREGTAEVQEHKENVTCEKEIKINVPLDLVEPPPGTWLFS